VFVMQRDMAFAVHGISELSFAGAAGALLFGAWVWYARGPELGMQYYTGFFIEKALSIDNIFVISLIFAFFAIPAKYQYRALLWGIIGVIVLRGLMIAAGAALVSEAYWVLYLFAGFLIVTGIKMFFTNDQEPDLANNAAIRWISTRLRVTKELHGDRFFVSTPDERTGRMVLAATPLFLALVLAACGPSAMPTPAPTNTPEPTATPKATATRRPTSTPAPTATPEVASRDNPHPLGDGIVVDLTDGGTIGIGVNKVVTGADALAMLRRANQFNDAPGEGNQFILARVYVKVEPPAPESFNSWDPSFWSVVANGRAVDGQAFQAAVMPKPEFKGEIIPPGEIEGWALFEVPETDDVAVVFLRAGDRGGYWFAAK